MLKIKRDKKAFVTLAVMPLADAEIRERYDLQEYICNSPDAFFAEIGQKLFLIAKEVTPSDTVRDRIDLLALDKEGRAVIIELKRGSDKLHLLQAISYAGMVAHWESEDFLRLLDENKREALEEFLEVGLDDINLEQRIILIAEEYDYSVLVAAEWLSEKFGAAIMCCRVALAEDTPTKSEYLVCNIVFPAPELAGQAKHRGIGPHPPSPEPWPNWQAALSDVTNPAVVEYFNKQIEENQECRLAYRELIFRQDRGDGKRHWSVNVRKRNAYVWQQGRFDGDITFWQGGLSQADQVQPVDQKTCLRFYLSSDKDFAFFHGAVTGSLQTVKWSDDVAAGDDDVREKEEGAFQT
jgi:hypothetical protein